MTSMSSCPATGSTGWSHSNPSEDRGKGTEQQTQYHSRMLDLEVFTVLVGLISSFY